MVELPTRFAIRQNCPEQAPRAGPPEEVLLVGRLVVGVSGGEHHPFDSQLHHFVEEPADTLRIGAVEQSCVRCDSEALFYCFSDSLDSQLVATLTANGKIVMLFLPVHVHGEGQVLAGLEKMKLFFQEQRVGAEIDVLLPRHQALDDLLDLRVHQRRILNFAASRACQVAAEQRLQHQHERVAFSPLQLLLEDVRGNRPHL